jgi:glucose uptake protein GlcU
MVLFGVFVMQTRLTLVRVAVGVMALVLGVAGLLLLDAACRSNSRSMGCCGDEFRSHNGCTTRWLLATLCSTVLYHELMYVAATCVG